MTLTTFRKPTIKDIARALDVTTTTVVNVLKGRTSQVSAATLARVRAKAKELGYVRNLTAASLVNQRSDVIAVVICGAFRSNAANENLDINPFYGDFVLRFEHEARARGYSLALYAGDEEGAVPFLLQRQYDAVLVLGAATPDLPSRIASHGMGLILIDSFIPKGRFTRVCADEARGGAMAAEHLLKRGRRKLVFVGDVFPDWPCMIPTIRYNAALAACRKARVNLKLIKCSTSFEAGVTAAELVREKGYDGVLCAADVLAAGVVQGLRHRGADVPADVAVVGYDNLLVARLCLPTLTTVDQRIGAKIRAALDLVQKPVAGKWVKIEPELVIRESA